MVTVRSCHVDDVAVETVSGEVDLDGSRTVLARILAEDAERVLVDCRASRKTLSFGDVLRVVREAAARPEAFAKRIALLNHPFNRAEVTQLFADRMRDAGLDTRDFYDRDEALAWLEEDRPAAPSPPDAR